MKVRHKYVKGATGALVNRANWNDEHDITDVAIADIPGLQLALDGKEASGTANAAIVAHMNETDPHTQYTTAAEAAAAAPVQSVAGQAGAITASALKAALGITTSDVSGNLDGSRITGTIPISAMPAGALDRLVIVANQAARYALTAATVQTGDTVKDNDTGLLWFVVDDTKLDQPAGYSAYTAGQASSVPWSGVTGLPTALQAGGTESQYIAGDLTIRNVKDVVFDQHADNQSAIASGLSIGKIYRRPDGAVKSVISSSLSIVLDGVTDNGPIINAKFASGESLVVIPNSTAGCRIDTTVILQTGQALVGEAGQSKVLNGCDASPMVLFRGSDATVMDLNITCNGSNASAIFRADTATATMERVTIEGVVTSYGYIGLDDTGGAGILTNLRTDRVHFRLHRGPGVAMTKAFAFTEIFNTVVDRIGDPVAGNHPGFSFSGFQGISLYNCEVTGTKSIVAGTTSAQTGFVFSNGDVVFADKCFADTCGGAGLSFSSVNYIRLANSTASLCDGVGMSFSTCTQVEMHNNTVGGRNATGAGNFTAAINGFQFSNCEKVTGSVFAARDCTGSGISKTGGSQIFAISSFCCTNNTGRGIVDSSSGAAVFSCGVTTGNTAGNISLASALQAVYATQVASGAFLNAQSGPFSG